MPSECLDTSARPKLSGRARVQSDKITGKPVLLYPEGALILNPTAHAIILLCTGEQSLESIVSNLVNRYGGPAAEISKQVSNFLQQLRAKNLLELI
jgi:coenzyme PQQ biosynthesis protein PqqD